MKQALNFLFMVLLINSQTGAISGVWPDLVQGNKKMEAPEPQVPAGFELKSIKGDPGNYAWPNPNGPTSCLYKNGKIISNPDVPQDKVQ